MMKEPHTNRVEASRRRRRASALYLTTVSISVLIATTALTITAVQRTDRRLHQNLATESESHWYARAGLEMAMAWIENTSDWRTQISGGPLLDQAQIGDGLVTVAFFDDVDADLANNEADPVRIVSKGEKDGSTYEFEVQLSPIAHDALSYALFAVNGITFKNDVVIRGPTRAHASIVADNNVRGEADARFETLSGQFIASHLTPQEYVSSAITSPQVDLSFYVSRATPLPFGDDNQDPDWGQKKQFEYSTLSSSLSSFGEVNPDGIYALDALGSDVEFKYLNLEGTLVIYNFAGKKVEFRDSCQMQAGKSGYPVLLVDTDCTEVRFDLPKSPREVRGVVHAPNSWVVFKNDTWSVTGCIIGREIQIEDKLIIEDAPSLRSTLIPGFLAEGMRVVSGSYQEASN